MILQRGQLDPYFQESPGCNLPDKLALAYVMNVRAFPLALSASLYRCSFIVMVVSLIERKAAGIFSIGRTPILRRYINSSSKRFGESSTQSHELHPTTAESFFPSGKEAEIESSLMASITDNIEESSIQSNEEQKRKSRMREFEEDNDMDRMLGLDPLPLSQSDLYGSVDNRESSIDYSKLFGQYKPKENPFADSLKSRPVRNVVPSPRSLKGVHSRQRRSQGQTPHESAAFNTVISDILNALGQEGPLRPGASPLSDPYGNKFSVNDTLWGARLSEKRRGMSLDSRPDNAEDDAVIEELDGLKEEMSIIATDAEMVDWAKRRVFTPLTTATEEDGPTFSRVYPKILAHLLKVIRNNFNNPHLALALFHHAQTHSLESYLTGCLSPVYNELLRVRWGSFRDLEGVEQGVREMEVNGVRWDVGTQKIVGKVVEEVGREAMAGHGETRHGHDVFDRLAKLDARVQKDIRASNAMFERKKAERNRIRSEQKMGLGEMAYA